jgi:hypothetical protein
VYYYEFDDEEDGEEGFDFEFDDEEEEQVDLRWCLVGRFICERAIHFNSMKVRMADLWKPVKGVTIKETRAGQFLFHFAHPLDMEAVLNGGPWSFDNNMLILEQVQLGMQIDQIPLYHVNMWVQVYDLPTGLMKEKFGIQLANYIGTFVEYDKNNNSSFWRQYMRLRVRIDVRLPLKKDTKVKDKEGRWCSVKFKYEKLGIFCFVCGVMGHAENKCEVRFSMEQDDGVRGWSAEIRADNRRQGGRFTSRWLREDGGGSSEIHGGERRNQPQTPAGYTHMGPTHNDQTATSSNATHTRLNPNHPAIITQNNNSLPINELLANVSAPLQLHGSNNNNNYTRPNLLNIPHPSQILSTTTPSQNRLSNQSPTQITINSPTNHSFPIIKTGDTIIHPLTSLYAPLANNNNNNSLPLILNNSKTDNINNQSVPALVFNSQPSTQDPAKLTPTNHKITRSHTKPTQPTRTKKLTQPDPAFDQTRPDKKTRIFDPKNNPVQNPIPKILTQKELQDMEVQGEKKRRREEEKSTQIVNTEHFLTASPGSQDCRDQ